MTTATAIPDRDNLKGAAWLLVDMSLNIWALSLVKALGLGYPAAQLVFLRALTGFVLIAPFVIRDRAAFRGVGDLPLHALRIALSVATLTGSFFVVARVPFAIFTAINFTRPLVVMVLAALILKEIITRRQWIAAGIALIGVMIALEPGTTPWSPALLALGVVVIAGSGAVIVTRRLRATPMIVMMAFYTGGLALCAGLVAAAVWTPVAPGHWLPLLAIGVFSQCAQFCFLRAHFWGDAGVVSVIGYLSLVLSTAVGYFVFDETPTIAFAIGAALVVGAALSVTGRRG